MKHTSCKFFYATLLFLFYSNSLLSDPSISEILRDRKSPTPNKQQLLLKQLPTSWQTLETRDQESVFSLLTQGKKPLLSQDEGTILQRAMQSPSPLIIKKVTAILTHSRPKDTGYRKGHIYELACCLYLRRQGVEITGVNTIYDRVGEIDIETTASIIECKNTHGWSKVKHVKRQLSKRKRLADKNGKKPFLYSQTPILDHMIKWLVQNDIDYVELSMETIIANLQNQVKT